MHILMVTGRLPNKDVPGSMAFVTRQIESIRALGAEVNVLEIAGFRYFKYLQALPKLRRMIKSNDLVHAHYGYCGWLAKSQSKVPTIISFMGDDLLGTPNINGNPTLGSRLAIRINRQVAKAANAVIVKSVEMAMVIAPVPSHIVPNGVDLQLFCAMDPREARAQLGWAENGNYILFPGCPDIARKGFHLAKEVVRVSAVNLKGPLKLVPLWNIQPDLVPLYLNASHALLMTSLWEGSPNVVKEAMACNLPVISVPVGDVPELLADVEVSAICPRDPGILAETLVMVLSAKRRSTGREAIKRRGLDLESVARKIVKIYAGVLQRKDS